MMKERVYNCTYTPMTIMYIDVMFMALAWDLRWMN